MSDIKTKYYKVNFDPQTESYGIHPCDDYGKPLPCDSIDSVIAAGRGISNLCKELDKLNALGYEPSFI